jgi:lipopolysaccharide export system protein LptA
MRRSLSDLLCVLFILLVLGVRPGLAQADGERGDEPLQVSSQRLESSGDLKQVKFSGDVVARQGDVVIHAGELVVHYTAAGGKVSSVEAFGGVRVEQGARVATGERGVFDVAESRCVLTGTPRIQQGGNFVEGDEITFFLDSDRSIVKSQSGSRVNAVFHPREKP